MLVSEGGGCLGILEMKGWIDEDSAFASPQLPLSIVTGRLGLLIKPCTFLLKNHSLKEVYKSTWGNLWYKVALISEM